MKEKPDVTGRKFLRVLLVKERETANTVRFRELEDPSGLRVTDTVYVRKSALKQIGNPAMIQVAIMEAEGEGVR